MIEISIKVDSCKDCPFLAETRENDGVCEHRILICNLNKFIADKLMPAKHAPMTLGESINEKPIIRSNMSVACPFFGADFNIGYDRKC